MCPTDITNVIRGPNLATIKLREALKDGRPGDTKTDEELKGICGKNTRVGGDGYVYLISAIKFCETNYNVVWQRITSANAIKCLTPEEIRATTEGKRKHIHRTAKRGARQLATALEGLPEAERQVHLTAMAHLGALAQFSSTKTQKQLIARHVTDTKKFLEAFKVSE